MSDIEKPSLRSACQSTINPQKDFKDQGGEDRLAESGVYRCRSFLSQHSTLSGQTSPLAEALGRDVRACYSQPLSMMEVPYVSKHLETYIRAHFLYYKYY